MGASFSTFRSINAVEAAWSQELHARRAEQYVSGFVKRRMDWTISVGRRFATAMLLEDVDSIHIIQSKKSLGELQHY